MDWESARRHCKERNWQWSLDLIDRAEKEAKQLEEKLREYEDTETLACLLQRKC